MAKRVIFIEGNIGSGKSTLIDNLKEHGYCVFEEPIKEWIETYVDEDGINILDKFYKNMSNHAFEFQILAMMTRWQNIRKALDETEDIIFIERSLETDRFTFALNLKEQYMTKLQWDIYDLTFDTFTKETECHFKEVDISYIYLYTSSEICFKRALERGRKEESTVPLIYLNNLKEKHDKWLTEHKNKVYFIDGNKTKIDVLSCVLDLLKDSNNKI